MLPPRLRLHNCGDAGRHAVTPTWGHGMSGMIPAVVRAGWMPWGGVDAAGRDVAVGADARSTPGRRRTARRYPNRPET